MDIHVIETSDLGDRSYVVSDGASAVVVDPQRDLDRVLAEIEARGLRVTHVVETHIHNDYVTGGYELARRLGAEYGVAAADEVSFDRLPLEPGQVLESGGLTVEVIHTPGHTPTHLSYAFRHGEEVAVCTGGSMLYGAVGRTDLLGADLAEGLAHDQYHSVRGLASDLPGATAVLPTHGFGSFCTSDRGASAGEGTIDDEKGRNPALVEGDEDAFVKALLAGYTAYPAYYRHMAPLNREGPGAADVDAPPLADADEVARRLAAEEWVVDVRDRGEFARRHRRGVVNFEAGRFFATYVGWVVPWQAPVTLVAESEEEAAQARRALARIGFDAVVGWAPVASVVDGEAVASYPVTDFAGLAAHNGGSEVCVLDVRRADEWGQGHVPGAIHIHLPDLGGRLDEVPEDAEVWVHCGSGFRAAVAASMLERAGRRVVLIDDEWANAEAAGVEVVAGA